MGEVPEHAPEVEALIAEAAAVQPEAVSLRNRYAVRSALFAGAAAFLLAIPFGGLVFLLTLPAAGFAVMLYHRSTGQSLSIGNGARLGWITGMFLFILLLITFTVIYAQPNFLGDFEKQLIERMEMPASEAHEAVTVFQSPLGVGIVVVFLFVLSTLPATIGGAIGAKLLRRD